MIGLLQSTGGIAWVGVALCLQAPEPAKAVIKLMNSAASNHEPQHATAPSIAQVQRLADRLEVRLLSPSAVVTTFTSAMGLAVCLRYATRKHFRRVSHIINNHDRGVVPHVKHTLFQNRRIGCSLQRWLSRCSECLRPPWPEEPWHRSDDEQQWLQDGL